MTLSPNESWLRACDRADTQIRFLVTITDGVGEWSCLDGPCDQFEYTVALQSVSSVSVELDPLTREMKTGSVEVVVDDAWIRPIFLENRLKHKKCTIKIGAKEILENSFLDFFVGPIEAIQPDNNGRVALTIENVMTIQQEAEISGYYYGHPLEIIEGILQNDLGFNDIDETSFDPSEYEDDISHFVVSRGVGTTAYHFGGGVETKTHAKEVIQSLCRLLNGQIVTTEDGSLAFNRFDKSASTVDHWDSDDIIPGSFEQLAFESQIINEISIDYARSMVGGTYFNTYHVVEDSSQGLNAYPGMDTKVAAVEFKTDWIDTSCQVITNMTDETVELDLYGPVWSFCGLKKEQLVAQDDWEEITETQPTYLLLAREDVGTEIVKVTSAVLGLPYDYVRAIDPDDGDYDNIGYYHAGATVTVERGQLATTAKAFPSGTGFGWPIARDITIMVKLCDELIERFMNELHVIKVRTGIGKYAIQIGDFVSVDCPQFMAYDWDGLTSADKFEVIGKQVEKTYIEWKLAYVDTESALTWRNGMGIGVVQYDRTTQSLTEGAGVGASVGSGFDYTDDGGREFTIDDGRAVFGNTGKQVKEASMECPASTTAFVYYNARTSQIGYYTGESEPDWLPEEIPLRSVTTNANDITATSDLRRYSTVDGVRLHESTVGSHQTLAENTGRNHNADFNQFSRGSDFPPDGWNVS